MVERFNGRISDVLKTKRFDSALDLEQTLMRYVHLYNTQLPQSALGSKTPMQAMKNWHKSHPHLFVKSPRNHTGRDSYRVCYNKWMKLCWFLVTAQVVSRRRDF